ncbi:reverse transcriptase domain-containing protein [Tanacetum coccineum]
MQNQMTNLMDMLTKFMNTNTTSTLSLGSLPSNTVANPRSDLKEITTQSGVSYDGPQVPPPPSSLPKVVKHEPDVTKDTVQPSTENIQLPVSQAQTQINEPVVAPKTKPTIPYPSRINKEKLREKDDLVALKFMEIFRNLHFELSFADALLHMPKFAQMTARVLIDVHGEQMTLQYDDQSITFKVGDTKTFSYNIIESVNQIDVINVACEEYAQEVLGFSNISKSGNPTPTLEPILSTSPPLSLLLREEFLNADPSSPLPLQELRFVEPKTKKYSIDDPPELGLKDLPSHLEKELKVCEAKTDKSSIDESPEVKLKDLPPHLEYAFLECNDMLPVVIAKDLSVEEKAALIKVFKSHKRAIAWKLSDIKGTFQRCMMAIFHDMIEKTMEVFMDDFLVFGNSFGNCLSHVDKMLQRIEVDKDKIDMIAKLPHPTTVKGVWSFLGHAGFYRRFIKDFYKISRPMTHLLEKNTPFIFSNECIQSFETLKKKLTEAPILIAPNWDLPFELMCDASDFAIGAVLGKRHEKHFRPIHYASKTMNEAESHDTTTKKEMLAVVYAFEKFRS